MIKDKEREIWEAERAVSMEIDEYCKQCSDILNKELKSKYEMDFGITITANMPIKSYGLSIETQDVIKSIENINKKIRESF